MKRRLLLVLGAAAALAAGPGCGEGSIFDNPTVEDPTVLTLTTSVEPDSVLPGDTMWITVTAKNQTRDVFRLEYDPCEMGLVYSIMTLDGRKVDGVFRMCYVNEDIERRTIILELGPGEIAEQRFGWTARVPFYGHGQAPSDYEVVGAFQAPGRPQSGPVPIRVLPLLPLDVETDPAIATSGDTVTIRVSVTNVSYEPADIPAFSSCGFGVWIRQGGQVTHRLTYCSSPDPIVAIRPGDRMEGMVEWRPEEAGDYEIFVQLVWPGQTGLQKLASLQVR